MKKFLIFFIVIATAFLLLTTGLKFTRIKSYYKKITNSIKTANWIKVFSKLDFQVSQLKKFQKRLKIDISAGCGSISAPEQSFISSLSTDLIDDKTAPVSPVLWAHQVGKKVVRKVPDTALLGVLVLIASELLRRGINTNSDTLPPVVREFANATIIELDAKLEKLSSLEWKVDGFFKEELENLQAQPLEVIDRFIVTSILPSVDKDFAPFLLKYMVGDAKRVKTITQSIKDLIQLSMVLLEGSGRLLEGSGSIQGPSVFDKTTNSIIEQVDLVGQNIEEVVNDWNEIVVKFTGSITEFLNTDSVVNLLSKQFLLKESTNMNLMNETVTILYGENDNQTAQRTLLWNSKRPWNVYSSLNIIENENRNRDKDKNSLVGSSLSKEATKAPINYHVKALTQGEIDEEKKMNNLFKNESWTSKLQKNKNKNVENTFLSSILFSDIPKKPAIMNDNNNDSTTKVTFRNPYAFTSYLQDLLEE